MRPWRQTRPVDEVCSQAKCVATVAPTSYVFPGSAAGHQVSPAVTLPAIGNGVTVRWWAEYPNGLRESTVHALTHATDAAASTPIGFIIERVNLNNRGPLITVAAGTSVTGTVPYQFWDGTGGSCPTCPLVLVVARPGR